MRLSDVPKQERRGHERWQEFVGCRVAVDGNSATLADLSPMGARFKSTYRPSVDTVLMFELPWGQPVRATVLAVLGEEVRVVFDEPIFR